MPEPGMIPFPRYRKNGSITLERLSPAQTCLRLMACIVNARNLPEYGFPRIARLLRTVPAYALEYSGFEQV